MSFIFFFPFLTVCLILVSLHLWESKNDSSVTPEKNNSEIYETKIPQDIFVKNEDKKKPTAEIEDKMKPTPAVENTKKSASAIEKFLKCSKAIQAFLDETVSLEKPPRWKDINFYVRQDYFQNLKVFLSNHTCDVAKLNDFFSTQKKFAQNYSVFFLRQNQKYLLPNHVKSWKSVTLEECKEEYAINKIHFRFKHYVSLDAKMLYEFDDVCFMRYINQDSIYVKEFNFRDQFIRFHKDDDQRTIIQTLQYLGKNKIFYFQQNKILFYNEPFHIMLHKIKEYLENVLQMPKFLIYYCSTDNSALESLRELERCKEIVVSDKCGWLSRIAIDSVKQNKTDVEKLIWLGQNCGDREMMLNTIASELNFIDLDWVIRKNLWQNAPNYQQSINEMYFSPKPKENGSLLKENKIFKFPMDVIDWEMVQIKSCTWKYALNKLQQINGSYTKLNSTQAKRFDACVLYYIQRKWIIAKNLKKVNENDHIIRLTKDTNVTEVKNGLMAIIFDFSQVIVLENDNLNFYNGGRSKIIVDVQNYLKTLDKIINVKCGENDVNNEKEIADCKSQLIIQ